MKLRKEKQLIVFKHASTKAFITPIIPASQALPTWYKDMSNSIEDAPPWDNHNIKSCMPMFDAMTQGYIVPLWSDLHVSVDKDYETGQWAPRFTWGVYAEEVIAPHGLLQTGGLPIIEKSVGGRSFKFLNPWVIQTPKDYSTLFVPPLNNGNDLFEPISAVVATDAYKNQINLPFVWKGPVDWEGVIPQGTPLVQLIPFKRVDFQHEISTMTQFDMDAMLSTKSALNMVFRGGYKKLWRKIVRST